MNDRTVLNWLNLGRSIRRLPESGGSVISETHFGLYSSDDPLCLPKSAVPGDLIQRLLSEGAIVEWDGHVEITKEGRERHHRARLDAKDGSEFRRVKQVRVAEASEAPVHIERDLAESPLAWLSARRDKKGSPILSAAQQEAGMRLHRDFISAGFQAPMGVNFTEAGCGTRRKNGGRQSHGLSDAILDARDRYQKALDILEPDLARIAVAVCCYETPLSAAEKDFGWPRRAAKLVLGMALNVLARHYGLSVGPAYNAASASERMRATIA